jgi:hypothetical protein
MPYPEIIGVIASIPEKFGGDIAQWMSQLHKGIDIAATTSDPTLRPLIGTDWRFKTGRHRYIDAQATPNEIAVNVANQAGARTIDIPVLAAGTNVPLYLSLQQTPTNKVLDATNNITFLNVPAASIINRLAKSQEHVANVYTDQANTFGAFDQKYLNNRLWIANAANDQWAKLGFLGTLSHNYDIVDVGADSYILAVSKTNVANGDVFYWSGGKLIRLGVGTNGQILKLVSGVPSWQTEIAAAGLPSRDYFSTDYGSSTALGLRYQSISGDSSSTTTIAHRQIPISNDISIKTIKVNMQVNSMNQPTRAGIVDDGVIVASVSIPATTTGPQSATITGVTIAAGSQVALVFDTMTAASGTYEIRPLMVEYEIGSPGAFEDAKVLVKEVGVQVGSLSRNLNFSIGTDFAITENVGANSIDIKIADNAISTALIGNSQVTLPKLAADSVDSSKIAPAAVGSDEIATGAVGPDELAANAVTTAKILDRNVTEVKINQTLLNKLNGMGLPMRRDWGLVNGRDPTQEGIGLLNNMVHDQTGTGFCAGSNQMEGTGVIYSTGTTAGTRAGERTADPVVMGAKNPQFFCRFSVGTLGDFVANTRLWFGLMTNPTLPNNNDPINSATGIGLQVRPTSSDFRIGHNNGNAIDLSTVTGVTPIADEIYTFYIYKEEGTNNWHWSIWTLNDGDINLTPTASGTINTQVPGGDTPMYVCMSVINVGTANVHLNRGLFAVGQDLTGAGQIA